MENSEITNREWTEFRINVPWGHIAGKWWGSKNAPTILALHGWQDNAGTFDPLIPLLPSEYSILAIDFPGHGFSSLLPNGMTYHYIDSINLLLRIMKVLKWNTVSIIGHSMGGIVGLWFAAMFPDKVKWLIAIDTLKPPQIPKERYWSEMGKIITRAMIIDYNNVDGKEPPSYTYDECVERLSNGSESVDKDKCHYLLERGLRKSSKYPNKYYFARDGRVKFINRGVWPQDYYSELAASIKIPHLYINASDSFYNESLEKINETLSVLRKNPLFEYVELLGRHHVHINNAIGVGEVISKFLKKYPNQTGMRAKL